jgi:restriction system protein
MSVWMIAVFVAAAGLAITAFWFGVSRRRKAETELGIQSLATLKWRDCIAIVLEALQREGYQTLGDSSDGGTDFLLRQGDEKVLLDYKHGTAYRLGESSVREFEAAVRLRGAARGILITLGSIEPRAATVAAEGHVQLIDGVHLWPKLRPFLNDKLLDQVRSQAAAATRKGMWKGVLASGLAGIVVFVVGQVATPAGPAVAAPPAAVASSLQPAGSQSAPQPAQDAMLQQLNATAEALEAVAKLTPEQLAKRRADAAKQVSQISQVATAAWSAPRTLLITLNHTDGKDKVLVAEACRILVQNEEMRFTRIQLNPPADSTQAVRWRLCE